MRVLLKDLKAYAGEIAGHLAPRTGRAFLACLEGDLGAGKTTFMQCFAKALGVEETVQSPTYVLMKKYAVRCRGFTSLIHIDAYRLEDPREFEALEPESFFSDPQTVVCIEWPEKIKEALPEPDLILQFRHRGKEADARDITASYGEP